MSDSPSTFRAEKADLGIGWDDRAFLHRREGAEGLLYEFRSLRSGSLAELVAYIAQLPENERGKYVIQKAGDHKLETAEIMALSRRPDFPGRRP